MRSEAVARRAAPNPRLARKAAPLRNHDTLMKSRLPLLPVAAALVLAGCSRHQPAIAAVEPPLAPAKVQLATVRSEQLPDLTEITGMVRPVERAQLAAKVMGTIEEMPVTLGQHVRRGELLVKINAAEISARVVQAQSQLNAARRDLDRERSLLAKGASTADMVRGLEDRFTAAQAMVHEAEAMLSYTTLRAPFDGVVARKMATAGDLAAPGMPLLDVEGTGNFQVEAGVPDSLVAHLKPGDTLQVNIPAASATFVGPVAELSSAADPGAHTVLAKITIPAGLPVRSGEFARVAVPGARVTSLMVPRTAVERSGQMELVFVDGENHRAVLRLVKIGADRGDQVEVLSGLDANERVVVAPPAGLREGQPLEAL